MLIASSWQLFLRRLTELAADAHKQQKMSATCTVIERCQASDDELTPSLLAGIGARWLAAAKQAFPAFVFDF